MTIQNVTVGDLEYNYRQHMLQVVLAAVKLAYAKPDDVAQCQRDYDALVEMIDQVAASKLTLYDKRDRS